MESNLKKKKDITDPDYKTKEDKLKDKKAKLKNKDGVRSKILDARLKRNEKKKKDAMEKAEKYAMVEVKKTGLIKKEEGDDEPKGTIPGVEVTYYKKHDEAGFQDKEKKGKIKGTNSYSTGQPHVRVKPAKKGSVHYKSGPIQYQHSSNLRMDDMVTTVGPLQGSTDPSTQLEQASPMGKKSNIVQKMANKRALKKMDADYNGIPGVQKSDFEQFKNK